MHTYLDVPPYPSDESSLLFPLLVVPQLEASAPERVAGRRTEGRHAASLFGTLVHDHILHLTVFGARGGRDGDTAPWSVRILVSTRCPSNSAGIALHLSGSERGARTFAADLS